MLKYFLKSSVENSYRPTISKTNCLVENLNDVNDVPLKIIKNVVMHFNPFRNTGCETLRI